MNPELSNTIIRVEAANTGVALRFALRLLPHMEAIRGRECCPALIGAKPSCGPVILFSNISEWSFANAIPKTMSLREDGVNTLIIMPEYTDWRGTGDTINADLYAFEDYLADELIDVITLDEHGDTWGPAKLDGHFGNLSETAWCRRRLRTMLSVMIAGGNDSGSLISPYGATPYFLLDPALKETHEVCRELRLLAGFPHGTHRKVRQAFGRFEPPFLVRTGRWGFPDVPSGPMPAEIGPASTARWTSA